MCAGSMLEMLGFPVNKQFLIWVDVTLFVTLFNPRIRLSRKDRLLENRPKSMLSNDALLQKLHCKLLVSCLF